MLKANRSWIYDRLFARSGAGAAPVHSGVLLRLPDPQLLPASGGIFPPCSGPRPALFDREPCKRPHFTLTPSTWPANKRRLERKCADQWLLPKVAERRGRGVHVGPVGILRITTGIT